MIEEFHGKPKGGKSDRELIVDHIITKKPGELITYSELGAIVGLQFAHSDNLERARVSNLVRRALSHLESNENMSLVPVPKEGYRVAHPNEFVHLSEQRFRSGTRKLRRAQRVAKAVDRSKLTQEELEHLDAQTLLARKTLEAVTKNNNDKKASVERIKSIYS